MEIYTMEDKKGMPRVTENRKTNATKSHKKYTGRSKWDEGRKYKLKLQ
jgi:hypothetical protein